MRLSLFKKYVFIFISGLVSFQIHAANKSAPTGIIENKACIQCHKIDNPELIKDWKKSRN